MGDTKAHPPNRPPPRITPEAHTQEPPLQIRHNAIVPLDPVTQRIWDQVAQSPLHNLWDFQGASPTIVWRRTFQAMLSDNLLSRAAEMGYYFLFALFPTLVSASTILGLAARGSSLIFGHLLHYLASSSPPAPTAWSSRPSTRPRPRPPPASSPSASSPPCGRPPSASPPSRTA